MWLVAWDRYALAALAVEHQLDFSVSLLHKEVVLAIATAAAAGGRSELLGVLYDELARCWLLLPLGCVSSPPFTLFRLLSLGSSGRTSLEKWAKRSILARRRRATRWGVAIVGVSRFGDYSHVQETLEEAKALYDRMMSVRPAKGAPKGPKGNPKGGKGDKGVKRQAEAAAAGLLSLVSFSVRLLRMYCAR